MFQQNMAMAMAFALVRETRSAFAAITKGRKEISPAKLNITGNRGPGSWMAWAPSCTKSDGNQPSELAAGPQRVGLTQSLKLFSSLD